KQKGGFSVGAGYVADVLIGSSNERLRRWRHDQLDAFGSGKERKRNEWAALARDLVRHGYLHRDTERFNVLEVMERGQAVIDGRDQVTLSERPELPTGGRKIAIECDETLFERLRGLRKRLADKQDVPAYVVFSDVALRQMAREYPANEREFLRITGVSAVRLRDFGAAFMREIAEHLRSSPRQTFARAQGGGPEPRREGGPRRELGDSPALTLRRFRDGQTVEQIAKERGFVAGTILNHLGEAAERGEEIDLARFLTPDQAKEIEAAFQSIGWQNIVGARERLGERYDYGVLRIYRAMRIPNEARAETRLRDESAGGDYAEGASPATETRLRGVSTRGIEESRAEEEGPALESA
ncbi:MAG: RQC domain-containing protein, partial [Vicinamibacteria bacterium]